MMNDHALPAYHLQQVVVDVFRIIAVPLRRIVLGRAHGSPPPEVKKKIKIKSE